MSKQQHDDTFSLYGLRIEVKKRPKSSFVCSHHSGDYFNVEGENLIFPKGMKVSMYALAAILPLLPAKERETNPNDWITTDTDVACPDPNCGAVFRITRKKKKVFRHSETTVVPLKKK